MSEKHTLTEADVPDEWIQIVRKIITDEGRAVRGPALRPVIQVKSLTDNSWGDLLLYSSAAAFSTVADRDTVLKKITG